MSEKKELTTTEAKTPETIRKGWVATPLVDIYENKDELLLVAELPGVEKSNLTINFDNNELSIDGLRSCETVTNEGEDTESVNYHRVFRVPQGIDSTKIKAELNHGLLNLHMPKSEALKPRQIEVKAG